MKSSKIDKAKIEGKKETCLVGVWRYWGVITNFRCEKKQESLVLGPRGVSLPEIKSRSVPKIRPRTVPKAHPRKGVAFFFPVRGETETSAQINIHINLGGIAKKRGWFCFCCTFKVLVPGFIGENRVCFRDSIVQCESAAYSNVYSFHPSPLLHNRFLFPALEILCNPLISVFL